MVRVSSRPNYRYRDGKTDRVVLVEMPANATLEHQEEKMIATFTCPLPPTLNDQIREARDNKFKSASLKKKWNHFIAILAIEQKIPRFTGEIWLHYEWIIKNFSRDPDNTSAGAKYVNDGLKHAGIIVEDNLKIIRGYDHSFARGDEDKLVLTISDRPIFTRVRCEKFESSIV
jgi:hypothetical protein